MDVARHFGLDWHYLRFGYAVSEAVDYAIEHEAWNAYQLADGSRLRMRVVLTRAIRSGTDVNGVPEYKFEHAVMCQVEPAHAEEKG